MFKKTGKGGDNILRKMRISPENQNIPKKKKDQEEVVELKNTKSEIKN